MNKKAQASVEFLFYSQAFLTFSLPSPNSLLKGNSSMINVTNTSYSSLVPGGGSSCQFHEAPLVSDVS